MRSNRYGLGYDCGLATRGLLATDHVILNHGQVTWTTPELAPPLLTTTPHQREDVSALDRFNVHRCPTRRVFSGTGLELVTKQATVRYLYHSATAATAHKKKYNFKNFLIYKVLSEAKNSVFQAEAAFSKAKCFQWDNDTAIESSYLDKLSLWPTGLLYPCRDFQYGHERKKSGCHSLQDSTD
ncbi:uncharacterized protein TNCV_973041 [Trichonephila clavipes]|nr:uncharacterized protein TNCV_973041 [Trichonephila clavipes]